MAGLDEQLFGLLQRMDPAVASRLLQTAGQLTEAQRLYQKTLAASGGDRGEAYNVTEQARSSPGSVPALEGLPQEQLALVNRIASGGDPAGGGFRALLLPAYEALKGIEQNTPVKPISIAQRLGVPLATTTNAATTPASLENALAGLLGPLLAR